MESIRVLAHTAPRPQVATLAHGSHDDFDGFQEPRASLASPVLEITIVDDRTLIRDCLGRSLLAVEPRLKLSYLSGVEDFDEAYAAALGRLSVVLLNLTSQRGTELIAEQISQIRSRIPGAKVIVLSETERVSDILFAFECGVSGYIPPSIDLEVAVRAMQLVAAGGVYLPSSVLSEFGDAARPQVSVARTHDADGNEFTSKQIAVIEALRRGKANKMIAYELNMCESTVKVHVRNVMKKLRAKNRTEAAYMLNEKMKTVVRA